MTAESPLVRRVVVLYPDNNDGRPGNRQFDEGVRAGLQAASGSRIDVCNEHLDLSSASDPDYADRLAEFLRLKYAGRRVDAVIAAMAPALDFALQHGGHMFPGTPVVFAAVDESELAERTLPAEVVGAPIVMDLAKTLDVALNLHPDVRHVYVVSGCSSFDRHWDQEAQRRFRPFAGRVEFHSLSELPERTLLDAVSRLPPHSLIYYLHYFQDPEGKAHIPAEVLERVAAAANAPVYSHVDSYIGRGSVGGCVFQWTTAGGDAARQVLRLLAGERPAQIGVQPPSDNVFAFDSNQLQKWAILTDSLPVRREIRNRVPTLWDRYKWQLISLISLCILQALTIIGMFVQRGQRQRAENRFRLAIDAAPTGMLMVDRQGTIVLANRKLGTMFGYAPEELMGQCVELLAPERLRSRYRAGRESCFLDPNLQFKDAGRPLLGLRKGGGEFSVEIGLSPLHRDAGEFVLASVVDITERLRAESRLLESQNQLRELTGRLMNAQEDERRRIARELHDDVNQTLALLALEIDQYRHRLKSDGANRRIFDELSTRVKQVSSDIHELSHQLHPFKLEQLGLAAAVRGLCSELADSYHLQVAFACEQLPGELSHSLAVAVFRIIQEALRNAIKHSRANAIQVSLRGTGHGLDLAIIDDGVGFDVERLNGHGGLGLVSIRERVRLMRGELTIRSSLGHGTRLEIGLPLERSLAATGAARQILRAEAAS